MGSAVILGKAECPVTRFPLMVFIVLVSGLTAAPRSAAQSGSPDSPIPARLIHEAMWGRVQDRLHTRNVVAAQVVLRSVANGIYGPSVVEANTDSDGRFGLAIVRPGMYDLVVRAIGYLPYSVRLLAGDSGPEILSVLLRDNERDLKEPKFRIRLTLVSVAPDTTGFRKHALVRLGLAPTISSHDFPSPACVAWDSTRTLLATLRVVITRNKTCGDKHPANVTRSTVWLPLKTPTGVLVVVGPDSAMIRISDDPTSFIPIEVDPPSKLFVLPQYIVGRIPYGSALVRCSADKYPASLCEGFADAFPYLAGVEYMRTRDWSPGELPPYHDPTVAIDPSVLGREVISMDAWLPDHFDRMVERSARFTGIFPGVQVEIIPAVGSRLVCDSGACRPVRADTAGRHL